MDTTSEQPSMPEDDTNSPVVDFGFSVIEANRKADMVEKVFSDVAQYYDKMNDVMSFGIHRIWKKTTIYLMDLKPGMQVLDIASGSGDMSALILPKIGKDGKLVMTDINQNMLQNAVNRLPSVHAIQCDGEKLPLPNRAFDRIILAFGLRNMTNRQQALAEAHRVLKWGGKLFVLEFSPDSLCPAIEQWYLTKVLPQMGKIIADDEKSYRYLGESILRFPPSTILAQYFQAVGFTDVKQHKFAGNIVVLSSGTKRS